MEDLTQKPKKKKGLTENQKSWLTFSAIGVIGFFGAFYLLFLTSPQEDTANKIAEQVKGLEGEGYNNFLRNFVASEMKLIGFSDEEIKTELNSSEFSKAKANLTMSEVKPFSKDEFGGVEIPSAKVITEAKLDEVGNADAKPKKISEEQYTNFIIKQNPENPNTYILNYDSVLKHFDPFQTDPAAATLVNIKINTAETRFELDANKAVKKFESQIKDVAYLDGSGAMTFVKLSNVKTNAERSLSENKTDIKLSLSADKIEIGDALSFFVPEAPTLKLNFDFAYSGEPMAKIQKIAENNNDLTEYFRQDAAEIAALKQLSAAEKFSGNFKLNNFSITTDSWGFDVAFDMQFDAFPIKPMPVGKFSFTVKDYPALIAYIQKFVPITQEEIDSKIFEAKAYFEDNGKDLTLNANFDGSRIITLGTGKKVDVIEEYGAASVEDAQVEEQPLTENKFEKDVESEAKPAPLPEIQKRELN